MVTPIVTFFTPVYAPLVNNYQQMQDNQLKGNEGT
jgi:hypothetical protein